eukprot:Seg4468.1 transcript_id=Seg4468.1/GoldUCD/mRNA.D3Y31 product="hypothetical protein" protein_id=Seg4468.1/GoldUCD/D3Y31
MKALLVLILGIVFTCQGLPANVESENVEDNQELEDAIEMNEPEMDNEQNEAFGDYFSEYEEDADNESDEQRQKYPANPLSWGKGLKGFRRG